MRKIKYLSPTSIDKFYKDRQEFYLSYLADNRPGRLPQTRPMSIGSAFDAYVKSYLDQRLGINADGFKLQEIFETQVEPHNRDWAFIHGKHAFDSYEFSGALALLVTELLKADEQPVFEATVEKVIEHNGVAINFLGKPDLSYKLSKLPIIYDWKVNGYCGKGNTSPKKQYMRVSDGWDIDIAPPSRGSGGRHKDVQPMLMSGIEVNIASYLENVDKTWAKQLAIYGWLLGMPVGSKFIVGIDQLCCKANVDKPLIRIANHRARISEAFQLELFANAHHVMTTVDSGHIFDDLCRAESDELCDKLDNMHKGLSGDSAEDKWFSGASRGHKNF